MIAYLQKEIKQHKKQVTRNSQFRRCSFVEKMGPMRLGNVGSNARLLTHSLVDAGVL